MKKLLKPESFSHRIGHGPIFCLSTGARYSELTFGGPGDQVVAKEHNITRGGFLGVRTTCPISIRVCTQVNSGRAADVKTIINRATDIMQDAFECSKMWLPWIMHVKTDLLDSIGDIWPGKSQVLEGTSKTPIVHGITNRGTIGGRELGIGVNRGSTWLAICHASTLQNLEAVLALTEMKARGLSRNRDAQEMMQAAKILHREFRLESTDSPPKKCFRGACQNNAINIEEQINHVWASTVDEQRCI